MGEKGCTLNSGLEAFDAFILVWSTNANRSNWVRQEHHSAIMRSVQDNTAKIIPCMLDETPLPPLIADRTSAIRKKASWSWPGI
jgi:TIR domain